MILFLCIVKKITRTIPIDGSEHHVVEPPLGDGRGGVDGLVGVRGRGRHGGLHGAEPAAPRALVSQYLCITQCS